MTDIEIANSVKIIPIEKIGEKMGIKKEDLIPYGNSKAKIDSINLKEKGKLILVTAINPTPLGEGKTTMSIGLTEAINKIGYNASVTLREPSLGPVFGVKGGAAGGGRCQVIPMEEINLHFTGDIHAITSSNNLLSALIDNHIQQGNKLQINPKKIVFRRCVDLNDRALRNIIIGMGRPVDGVLREESFTITAASEIMAILCLSSDLSDLKRRLGNILIGYNYEDKPIFASDLKAEDAMTILLKEAIKPNLVQTLEGNPAFVHGGPFANIAHGCCSVISTKTALSYCDYVVTEAGFGADLGLEKFLHIKCRQNDLTPSVAVVVATVKALKYHGEGELKKGIENLEKHIENITQNFNLRAVVAINKYNTDTKEEISTIIESAKKLNVKAFAVDAYEKGSMGAIDLAREVVEICNEKTNKIQYLYELSQPIKEKITNICVKNYGASEVVFSLKASDDIKRITELGFNNLPIIIAKTQYSFSDNPSLKGRPKNFAVNIREVLLKSGAEFITVIAGDIMLMPGLPINPASNNMTIDEKGKILGLF